MAKTGPKPIQIDWAEVDKLISYQCTQEEVAAFFDCSVDTLERHAITDLNVKLADLWIKKRALGRVRLRKAQLALVEKGGPGAATMAIYLDKKMFPNERPDLPPPPPPPSENASRQKAEMATFDEFCQRGQYYKPYPKQEEMRAFGLDETDTRLLLGSRGYGKTDFVTIAGTAYDIYKAWFQGLEMDLYTNLIITKSNKRCASIVNEIAHLLKANGVELEKENESILRVKGLIGQDHSVEAITIKTSMRGRHPKRIIMDDPVTDEDVSEAMRLTVKRRYDEAYKLCSNILIIGQPAHFDDLYANLRGVIKTLEVPYGQIPELDPDLEAMKAANVDLTSIEMSYHLRVPVDGNAPFVNIKYLDHFPAGVTSVAFIDPSEGGDFTGVTGITQHFNGLAIEGNCWKKAWYHCLDEMLIMFKALGVKKVCIETNKFGEQAVGQLRQFLAPHGIGVVGKYSDDDKHAAIMNAGSYAHMIHLSRKSNAEYTKQVTKYEYGVKYDDGPDSLARGMEWLGFLKKKK